MRENRPACNVRRKPAGSLCESDHRTCDFARFLRAGRQEPRKLAWNYSWHTECTNTRATRTTLLIAPRERFHEETLDGLRSRLARFLRRSRLDRHSDLPGSPTDCGQGRHDATARWSSTPVRFKQAKTSGSRWAAWKSARFGDTAAMSHRTGPPIGCIEKPSSSSTAGQPATSANATSSSMANSRPN